MTANLRFKKLENASSVVCAIRISTSQIVGIWEEMLLFRMLLSVNRGTPVPFKVKDKSNLSSKDLSLTVVFEYYCQFSVKR